MKRRWDALSTQLSAGRKGQRRGLDTYWEAVGDILDGELYLAGGCDSAKAFLEKYVGENERSARRMVRVARFATSADESTYRVSKLDAALGYLDAKGESLVPGKTKVDFGRLKIEVRRDGKDHRLGLDELSVEAIRNATRALQRKGKRVHPKASTNVKALVGAFGRLASLREVSVHEARGTLSIKGIPTKAWAAFKRAVNELELED